MQKRKKPLAKCNSVLPIFDAPYVSQFLFQIMMKKLC